MFALPATAWPVAPATKAVFGYDYRRSFVLLTEMHYYLFIDA
jgi:hypothetical protein